MNQMRKEDLFMRLSGGIEDLVDRQNQVASLRANSAKAAWHSRYQQATKARRSNQEKTVICKAKLDWLFYKSNATRKVLGSRTNMLNKPRGYATVKRVLFEKGFR